MSRSSGRTQQCQATRHQTAVRLVVRLVMQSGSWIALLAAPCQGETAPDEPPTQPNFVVIVADDAGWRDVGYHDSEIATPTIDQLAKSGVELDAFYVCPTCSPTRAALMTGRPPSRFGIFTPVGPPHSAESLPSATHTLPQLLADAGYTTAITGKWHLGERPEIGPLQFGFDQSYGFLRGQVDPHTHRYKSGDRTWHRNDRYIDELGHATDLITNEATRFLRAQATDDAPFFLYVAYSVPHYPLDESQPWTGPYVEKIANASRRLYAASMTHMDTGIGTIVQALEATGQTENTVLVFFSDNGGQRSFLNTADIYEGRYAPNDQLGDNRPLRGWKTQLYEGGIRVPALISWPGKLSSNTLTSICAAWDLLPTLAALAKVDIPTEAGIEGVNIWPWITGETEAAANRLLYWRTAGGMALRQGPWKLIHHGKSLDAGRDELFNLNADPYETNECGEAFPQQLASLRQALQQQRAIDTQTLHEEKP